MAASLSHASYSATFTSSASKTTVSLPSRFSPSFNVSTFSPFTVKPLNSTFNPHAQRAITTIMHATSAPSSIPSDTSTKTFHGLCYVVGDNIDTDQIIPAEYLTLVPSNPAEYEKLGSYALIGLPSSYATRFIEPNESKTKYTIVIGGANFGCGSSREHAPVALGAAGAKAVVAESYARIFFRNSVATGEVYPLESEVRICEECRTGDVVTIELGESRLINHTTGKEYKLKPIGDAGPVIEAGGIFAYARKTGMIPS
ncbi:isopropylmalate isomerase small subunit 1 [Hibiscus trionum]|uniref:3-isopropylmalate dehydratase n=1 Tax=Hibiscus trionum TaxID=183268 RepID=A0A9W7IX40_HIBTR|nr:isopropylmalate isomerase small subunit 1 [Hibiscus trionum]